MTSIKVSDRSRVWKELFLVPRLTVTSGTEMEMNRVSPYKDNGIVQYLWGGLPGWYWSDEVFDFVDAADLHGPEFLVTEEEN